MPRRELDTNRNRRLSDRLPKNGDNNPESRGLHSSAFRINLQHLLWDRLGGFSLPQGVRWPIPGGPDAHDRGVRCPLQRVQVPMKGGSGAH
jgi:hypothetical protein